MAKETSVNPQITDAVTGTTTESTGQPAQAKLNVLGDAPVIAMGNLYQATSQALGNAAHNAVYAQQQTNIVAQAATTQGVAMLYSLDTSATGAATDKITLSDLPTTVAALKTEIETLKKQIGKE